MNHFTVSVITTNIHPFDIFSIKADLLLFPFEICEFLQLYILKAKMGLLQTNLQILLISQGSLYPSFQILSLLFS